MKTLFTLFLASALQAAVILDAGGGSIAVNESGGSTTVAAVPVQPVANAAGGVRASGMLTAMLNQPDPVTIVTMVAAGAGLGVWDGGPLKFTWDFQSQLTGSGYFLPALEVIAQVCGPSGCLFDQILTPPFDPLVTAQPQSVSSAGASSILVPAGFAVDSWYFSLAFAFENHSAGDQISFTVNNAELISDVPEPGTCGLAGFAVLLMVLYRRRILPA